MHQPSLPSLTSRHLGDLQYSDVSTSLVSVPLNDTLEEAKRAGVCKDPLLSFSPAAMPIPTTPEIRSYEYVKETTVSNNLFPSRHRALTPQLQANLDWADFITIDLSLYSTPEGKKELARALITAVHEKGFFYVKNFNIPQQAINRQFAIGRDFHELPLEEKQKYTAWEIDQGNPNGYVPVGRRMCVALMSLLTTQVDPTDNAKVLTKSLV